ncbi:LUD domain-containing protein [Cesiribacter sp. SM1]|uniref:LutC/YkgG family protein n=1 Tax=Cesiribacter sp. SM1 TaxID=2861196 RepID=UPI001CD77B20|nr:LUD domain-containing protein [Cesiribacter sp. SM1]
MSSSRNYILSTLTKNKPARSPLPELPLVSAAGLDLEEKFSKTAISIGSSVHRVKDYGQIEVILKEQFPSLKQVVSRIGEAGLFADQQQNLTEDPHALEAVDLAILKGQFAVAENSAIWIEENGMGTRVLPFICQHLAIVIHQKQIVASMHQAYDLIGDRDYGYGVFIAGPSKTADIEQSLVLGAHGPRSLHVFILAEEAEKVNQ